MVYGICRVYGKTFDLARIFTSKRGWIALPVNVSLKGIDMNEEEQ